MPNSNSFHIVRPSGILQEYIESYYLVELLGSKNSEAFEQKPIANGCEQLFIGYQDTVNTCFTNIGEEFRHQSGIVGTRDLFNMVKSRVMEPNRKVCKFVSINFKPGGLYNIFKTPSSELYNSFLEASVILGNELQFLQERLAETTSFTQRASLLDIFLLKQIEKRSHKNYNIGTGLDIANYIRYYKGKVKVSQLKSEFKVTERTLQRYMKVALGITPKEYCKITRFNNLLSHITYCKQINWFDMVNQFGYHDRSHLFHEFKGATGITPDIYLKNLNKHIFKIDHHIVLVNPNNIYSGVYDTIALAETQAASF